MLMTATELARLLRKGHHDAAAAAAEAGQADIVLSAASRDSLIRIYGVRRGLQAKDGRPKVAAAIQRLLDALDKQSDETVYGCQVSDEDRHHAIFLNSKADAILAVVVPPRRPNGELDD